MLIIIKLILAHLVGDFLLQPYSWVVKKEQKKAAAPQLYYHCAVHAALIWAVLWDSSPWLVGIAIAAIHFCIDTVKIYLQTPQTKTRWFIADQLMHILSLVVVWQIWKGQTFSIFSILQSAELWIYAVSILFLSVTTRIVLQILMYQWSMVLPEAKSESLANAGKYIGILERLLVFVFVVNGQWEAVGFLLAAKSVFRFGDLTEAKDRKLTEYILIGTLLSFGIAIITGMAAVKIISLY